MRVSSYIGVKELIAAKAKFTKEIKPKCPSVVTSEIGLDGSHGPHIRVYVTDTKAPLPPDCDGIKLVPISVNSPQVKKVDIAAMQFLEEFCSGDPSKNPIKGAFATRDPLGDCIAVFVKDLNVKLDPTYKDCRLVKRLYSER